MEKENNKKLEGTLVFNGIGRLVSEESILPGELKSLKNYSRDVWPISEDSVKEFLQKNLGKEFSVRVPEGKSQKRKVYLVKEK